MNFILTINNDIENEFSNDKEIQRRIKRIPQKEQSVFYAVFWWGRFLDFWFLFREQSLQNNDRDSLKFVNGIWKDLYDIYIQSEAWKIKSKAIRFRFGNKCQVCNKSADEATLHAHHRTYERLGRELPEDLTVLCESCHDLYHSKVLIN